MTFFETVRSIVIFGNVFGCVSVFCIIICCFKCVYRIRCIFLYICIYVEDVFDIVWKSVPEVWTIFVRRILCVCWWFFGIWGVLNGPPPLPPPSPASMSKFPSGEEKYKINVCLSIFYDFYKKKLKKCTKMVLKWLRRVAFVG